MKYTLTTNEAAEMLQNDKYARWSYAGASALVEHLERQEEESGIEMEFDLDAIRSEYSEYESATAAAKAGGWEPDIDDEDEDSNDEEDIEAQALQYLEDNTLVIEFNGGIIIQDF